MPAKSVIVQIPFRDHIEFHTDGKTEQWKIKACSSCMALLQGLKKKDSHPENWPLPKGNSHSELLVKELILKVKGQWQLPYQDTEICHCRAVTTEKVVQAIKSGAHSTKEVSRLTQASTSCGTCRTDVEKLLQYILKAG